MSAVILVVPLWEMGMLWSLQETSRGGNSGVEGTEDRDQKETATCSCALWTLIVQEGLVAEVLGEGTWCSGVGVAHAGRETRAVSHSALLCPCSKVRWWNSVSVEQCLRAQYSIICSETSWASKAWCFPLCAQPWATQWGRKELMAVLLKLLSICSARFSRRGGMSPAGYSYSGLFLSQSFSQQEEDKTR